MLANFELNALIFWHGVINFVEDTTLIIHKDPTLMECNVR